MELNIIEKYLLVGQHPNKGKFITSGINVNYGICGAILMQMAEDGKISINENKLVLKDYKNVKDSTINEAISLIKKSKKPRKISYWISKLEKKVKVFKWAALKNLERGKFIRIEEKRFLRLFRYKKCYLVNRKSRDMIIKQLKESILYRKGISNENIILLALIQATGMQRIFTSDRKELKTIKKKLKELMKEVPVAGAVDKTIKEMLSEITVAVTASITATSSSYA